MIFQHFLSMTLKQIQGTNLFSCYKNTYKSIVVIVVIQNTYISIIVYIYSLGTYCTYLKTTLEDDIVLYKTFSRENAKQLLKIWKKKNRKNM